MSDIAGCIEREQDPSVALDDHGITDADERKTLKGTIATLQRLHGEGRDHIWVYYTRNLVRPVALARAKVDVIAGNPPWLNYNKTANTLRRALEEQSKTPLRNLGRRKVRHPPGRGRPILCPMHRSLSQRGRCDRHGHAAQRSPNRTVLQVA